jgi:hypothetical protein
MKGKNVVKKSRVEEWDAREKDLSRKARILDASKNGGHSQSGNGTETTTGQDRRFNPKKKFQMTIVSFEMFVLTTLFLTWIILFGSTLFLCWFVGIVSVIISGIVFCNNYGRYFAIWLFNSLTQPSLE